MTDTPTRVEIRQSVGYRLLSVVPCAALGAIDLVAATDTVSWVYGVLLVALVPVGVLLGLWFGADLTDDVLVARGYRRRVIPWSKIQAITQESVLGATRVAVYTFDGTHIRLMAPFRNIFGAGSARFDADFHRIGQWWLTHRGPSWQPSPVYWPPASGYYPPPPSGYYPP